MTDNRSGTNDFWDVLYTQRAIRYWTEDAIPDDVLLKLIEAGTKAPSGSNSQPWRFLFIRDAATRKTISDLLSERFEANMGLQTYIRGVAASEDRSRRLMGKGAVGVFTNLHQAPVFFVPCLYRGDGVPLGDLNVMSGSSIYGAVQNVLLAARALGLGTVMTTMNGLIEPELREILQIPESAQPVALIPIGYPAANFGPTNRMPANQVTFWERWGEDVP